MKPKTNVADMNSPIGIIGFGDLGSKLAMQLAKAGLRVIVYDISSKSINDLTCVDHKQADYQTAVSNVIFANSTKDVLSNCSTIHWALPSGKLSQLPELVSNTILVLHDSVMNNSYQAINNRKDKDQFVIAHCLMNNHRRVFVSSTQKNNLKVFKHFKNIGLLPKLTTIKEHDILMARTQGVFALLIEMGLAQELENAFRSGDLTSSAAELRHAVKHRESHWTTNTIKSILANPELAPFAHEIFKITDKN